MMAAICTQCGLLLEENEIEGHGKLSEADHAANRDITKAIQRIGLTKVQ